MRKLRLREGKSSTRVTQLRNARAGRGPRIWWHWRSWLCPLYHATCLLSDLLVEESGESSLGVWRIVLRAWKSDSDTPAPLKSSRQGAPGNLTLAEARGSPWLETGQLWWRDLAQCWWSRLYSLEVLGSTHAPFVSFISLRTMFRETSRRWLVILTSN